MADVSTALAAVHDPTRRAILEHLRSGERSVRELTDVLPVTQPAVSQHLRALRAADLVTVRPDGARRLYRIDRDGLASVRSWVDSFWDDALTSFVEHVERSSDRDVESDGPDGEREEPT
ncbi:MAG: metalloregulator ArsR/SmtB family transcription factor [Actinomycetota bacterium]